MNVTDKGTYVTSVGYDSGRPYVDRTQCNWMIQVKDRYQSACSIRNHSNLHDHVTSSKSFPVTKRNCRQGRHSVCSLDSNVQ